MATVVQSNRIQNTCLLILAALAVGFELYWFRDVLIPFVLAVFVAYGLGPIIDGLRSSQTPETVAGALGVDFETSLRRIYERARTLEQVEAELRQLRETMDAILSGMDAATTEHSPQLAQHQGTPLRLVDSTYQPDGAPRRPTPGW